MTDNEKNSVSKLSYGDKFLIFVPNEGNYIEILGHRIDGFESFEAFCEHLKKYAELEETVKAQKAEIEHLKSATNCYRAYEEEQKAEAVKEFAERLHCHCQSIINEEWNKKVYPTSWADAYEEFADVVDNLVKEMVGES